MPLGGILSSQGFSVSEVSDSEGGDVVWEVAQPCD